MADHTKVPVADVRDGKVYNRRVAEKFSSEQFADAAIDFLESRRDDEAVLLLRRVHRAPRSAQSRPKRTGRCIIEDRPPLPANFLPQHPFTTA